jgi:hypothetical protein
MVEEEVAVRHGASCDQAGAQYVVRLVDEDRHASHASERQP